MHKNAQQRLEILSILYEAREAHPRQGWVFERELRGRLDDPGFALEILKEQGYLDDGGVKYRITAKGALACEAAQ